METNNTGRRINSIDIVRLFCALLVVTEHTMPLKDFNPAVWDTFFRICVLAVPYFFVVSGFFVAQSNNKIKILKQYIKYYLIWTVVYDVWMLLDWAFMGAYYGRHDLVTFIEYRIIEFVGWGSFYHLWFLWTLIFCLVVTIIFEKIRLEKVLIFLMLLCFIIGLILVPYYGIIVESNNILKEFVENLLDKWWFDHLSNVLIRGIPYFYLGYWLEKWKADEKYKIKNWQLICLIILYTAEQIIISQYGIARSVALTFFMYLLTAAIVLWLMQHPFNKYNKFSKFSRGSANFIYFVHALVIEVLIRIFGVEKMTIHFVWAIIICMLLAIFRYWLQEKRYLKA